MSAVSGTAPAPAAGEHAVDALLRMRDGVYAADLLIAVVAELDLFTWLADHGPCDRESLCAALGLHPHPGDVMVTYLIARGLLEHRSDGLIHCSAEAALHLTAGAAADLRDYLASLRERPACAELLHVLRTGTPAAWASAPAQRDYPGRLDSAGFAARITAAMDARGRALAPALAAAVADLPMNSVLDVGGGSGIYGRALLQDRPEARLTVLERPPVDRAARTCLADLAPRGGIGVSSGDMFARLPEGHDVHLFSHVLHDWSAGQVRTLLARSFEALAPGGWFIDHDAHINHDKTGPLAVAEYSVLLMHSTPGKCWSLGELAAMLAQAGFTDPTVRPAAGHRSVLLARKPSPCSR